MGRYGSARALREAVEAHGGVLSLDVAEIRDACGVQRLAKLNVVQVENALRKERLGSWPSTLSGKKQGEWVRLFVKGSPVASFLAAARKPTAIGDEILRELSGEASGKLERIRAVLDDASESDTSQQGPWRVRLAKSVEG